MIQDNFSLIPVSVVVVTKNEACRIGACLQALSGFGDVWVVDSGSEDGTLDIAARYGARGVNFVWDGRYPKKRGWCLENLELAYDWVFFVDADEIVSTELLREFRCLSVADEFDKGGACAGYFVRGRYVWGGRHLCYGLCNNKLALFDRRKIEFPVVNDLEFEGMGEIEGHYQPVLRGGFAKEKIGQLSAALYHAAEDGWEARHRRYARWEAQMNACGGWPDDPKWWRQMLKRAFRALSVLWPVRSFVAFLHCYVLKLGFMDGAAGFDFARSRGRYYRMISDASKDLARLF